jgi:hypothetical protein
LALKLKRYSKEDLIVGVFMLLAILYPFIVAVYLFYEESVKSSQEKRIMRESYRLLSGVAECEQSLAERVAMFMSEELLLRLGGVKGILQRCLKERTSSQKLASIEEEFTEEGRLFRLVAVLKRRDKGVAKAFKSALVIAVEERDGFRIIDVKISRL